MSYQKTYLGDGVYGDIEHGMVKLTTENGARATNTIYLEPEVFDALTQFVKRVRLAPGTRPGFETARKITLAEDDPERTAPKDSDGGHVKGPAGEMLRNMVEATILYVDAERTVPEDSAEGLAEEPCDWCGSVDVLRKAPADLSKARNRTLAGAGCEPDGDMVCSVCRKGTVPEDSN